MTSQSSIEFYCHLSQSDWCRVGKISKLNLRKYHHSYISVLSVPIDCILDWFFFIFVLKTWSICARSIVWWFINNSWAYTLWKRSTKLIYAWRTRNSQLVSVLNEQKMTRLVYILDVILEYWGTEWIFLAVLILWVCPFKFFPKKL